MTDMIEIFDTILSSPFLMRALIGAVFIALVAAASGTFLVFRGLSFMTAGVAHAALGGAALGLFLQETGVAPWFDPMLGALAFSVFVAVVTGYAGETGLSQKMEVAVGVSFALSMSIAVFLMYYIPPTEVPRIWGYLIGDILLLDTVDVVMLACVATILVIVTAVFNREFVYVSVDMEGSIAHGLNARAYHYLMLITSALAIALATKAVGAILVYAIMVAPAAASSEVLRSVRGIVFAVFCIALISQFTGIGLSLTFRASPSAIAGILAALTYIVAMQIRALRNRAAIADDDLLPSRDAEEIFHEAADADSPRHIDGDHTSE